MSDCEWISVREASVREGVTERAISNRLKRGEYKTKLTKDGRRLIQWTGKKLDEDVPEVSLEAFRIMEKTMEILLEDKRKLEEREEHASRRLEAKTDALQEALQENAQYKQIAEHSTFGMRDMERELHELRAKIKELEMKAQQRPQERPRRTSFLEKLGDLFRS